MTTETKPAPPSDAVRSTAELAASLLAGLQQAIRGQHNAASLLARGQRAEAQELFSAVGDSFVLLAKGLAAIRDNSNKLADLLEQLEAVQASAKAAPPAAAKKMSFWQPGQERFAQDAIDRVVSAACREIGKRAKHADSDRARFTGWLKGYLSTGGKYHQYAARAVASVVGDAGGERVAVNICQWTLEHFDGPRDPAERLGEWQEDHGRNMGMAAVCRERYDAGCREIEARQLAAACA